MPPTARSPAGSCTLTVLLRRISSRTAGGSRGGSSIAAMTCPALRISRSARAAASVSTRTRPYSQAAVVRSSTSNTRVSSGFGSVTRSSRGAWLPTTATAAATWAYGWKPHGNANSGQRRAWPASIHSGR